MEMESFESTFGVMVSKRSIMPRVHNDGVALQYLSR